MSDASQTPIDAERSRLRELQEKVGLKESADRVLEIQKAVALLPQRLRNLRHEGYVFLATLDEEAAALAAQWPALHATWRTALSDQQSNLREQALRITEQHTRGVVVGAVIETLESGIESAADALGEMVAPFDERLAAAQKAVERIELTMKQVAEKSFDWLPGEAPVQAVPANWKKPGDKDGVEGVLFLSDQRLLFEQKEEVATKKVLFITMEKKKVQGLQWALALAQVASATGSTRGFLGKDDFLTVASGPGGPFETTDLHLRGQTGADWQARMGEAQSGALATERAAAGSRGGGSGLSVDWALASPVMVRTRDGILKLRAFGAGGVGAAQPDLVGAGGALTADAQRAVQTQIVSQLTDVLGELSSARTEAELVAMTGEIASTTCSRAAAKLAPLGLTLADVTIRSLGRAPE